MSNTYHFSTIQKIPVTLEKAWSFFSKPDNLSSITPSELDFKIISVYQGQEMYPGQIIEYKVRPLLGIPVYWMTEITHVEKGKYFVDEQRFGPYQLWHHQHHFKEIEGGVEMTDIVHYKIPLGLLGDIAHALFVKRSLENIFKYRYKAVEEIFGNFSHK
jgi:ligand-binding SRPBCC domain-containing protein